MDPNIPSTEVVPPQDILVAVEAAHALQEELAVPPGQPLVCHSVLLLLTYTKQVR
jgi:hypothetical protein